MPKHKRVALYARVSTDDQTTENQVRELKAASERHGWDVVAQFVDHGISGAKGRDKRPQFDALLKGVARREFDMVAAWGVDRLGRSMTDLLSFLGELQGKGVDLYLHQQAVDTSTPAGRALFQMCGVFAEFERAMIQERVKAGIARYRANPKNKPWGAGKTAPEVEDAIRVLRAEGMGKLKIGRTLGIGTSVVQRVLAEAS
jgi:DNA invertase Pin-like site-specific DNA recombinase